MTPEQVLDEMLRDWEPLAIDGRLIVHVLERNGYRIITRGKPGFVRFDTTIGITPLHMVNT